MLSVLKLFVVIQALLPLACCLTRSGRGFRFVPIGQSGNRRITDPYYIEFLLGRLKRDIPHLFPSTTRRAADRLSKPNDYQEFILGKRSPSTTGSGIGYYVIQKDGQYLLCTDDSRQIDVKRDGTMPDVDYEQFLLGKRRHDVPYCRPLAVENDADLVASDVDEKRDVPDYEQFILGKRDRIDYDDFLFAKRGADLDPTSHGRQMTSQRDRFDVNSRSLPDYIDFVIGPNVGRRTRTRRSVTDGSDGGNDTTGNGPTGNRSERRKRDDHDLRDYVPRRGYFSFRDFLFGHKRIPDYGQFILGKKSGRDFIEALTGRRRRLRDVRAQLPTDKPSYSGFLMGKRNAPDYGAFIMGKKTKPDYDAFLMGKKDGNKPNFDAFLMGKKVKPSYEAFLMGKKNTPDYENFLMGKRYTPEYEEFLMGKKNAPDYEKFLMGKKYTPEYEEFLMGKKNSPYYGKFIMGKKDVPDYEKFLMGKKYSPEYEEFLMGKRDTPDYERFLMGKKYTPEYEEFLMGKKSAPNYEQFLMGKKNMPDYEQFLMGKKTNPDYEQFLMGKKDNPDYERFIMGKRTAEESRISAPDGTKVDYGLDRENTDDSSMTSSGKENSGSTAPSSGEPSQTGEQSA